MRDIDAFKIASAKRGIKPTYMNVGAAIIEKMDENGTRMFLLIQRAADDHWPLFYEFPRGKCDRGKNENIIDCTRREIKEETGLDVDFVKLLGTYKYVALKDNRISTCYVFHCRVKDPNQPVKLSKEHQNYKWVSQMGVAELLVLPDQEKFLKMVVSKENPIVNTDMDKTDYTLESYLRTLQKGE